MQMPRPAEARTQHALPRSSLRALLPSSTRLRVKGLGFLGCMTTAWDIIEALFKSVHVCFMLGSSTDIQHVGFNLTITSQLPRLSTLILLGGCSPFRVKLLDHRKVSVMAVPLQQVASLCRKNAIINKDQNLVL